MTRYLLPGCFYKLAQVAIIKVMEKLDFPKGFLWGSATSSYQVEGGIENNDWAEAGRQGKVPLAGRACDHYNLYEKDFDIVKELGQNAHRLSIEWARVEPEEGKFDEKEIEHYRKVLQALRDRGIEPFVTLWHFTLPLWFAKKGGFENPKAPEIFARYCGYMVEKLGDMAKFWITINEPIIYSWQSYVKGVWPPFKKNIFTFKKVTKTLISSHLASHNVIKKINPSLQVGIAKNNMDFDSSRFNLLGRAIQVFRNKFWNHYFLKKISRHQDFLGLNYYFHKHFGYKFYEQKSDMGWAIYPKGIYHLLKELKRYNLPIYITENGLADAVDQKRAKFIKDHLHWAQKAMQEGVDLKGYFYWSLLDNFEWAHGFDPRFGLIEVDYETMERKIRPSAWEYKRICETNSLEI